MGPEAILLSVARGGREGSYRFVCPVCADPVEKPADRKIVALLVSAGVDVRDRGREGEKATALLPETHVCIVRRSRLVDTMEGSFAMLRNERGEPPRATFFVSGPSRTADIEQTIVVGAHGPYRVHVILVP